MVVAELKELDGLINGEACIRYSMVFAFTQM